MDYAGEECVPAQVGLIEAYTHDRTRVAVLQRPDGPFLPHRIRRAWSG